MPVSYDIAVTERHACVVGADRISMSACIRAMNALAADPRFESDFTVLLDLRDVQYTARSEDGDELAAELRQKKKDFENRMAVVVSESLFLLTKLYCLLANMAGFEDIKCFTDIHAAMAWCRNADG